MFLFGMMKAAAASATYPRTQMLAKHGQNDWNLPACEERGENKPRIVQTPNLFTV